MLSRRQYDMKIHAICLVKNEADIIAQTLARAAEWCDHIYVVDNGSDDSTWEEVAAVSQKHSCIIAHKRDFRPYNNGMRGEVFHEFRSNSKPGDWWCRLDADEIYIDNPREFLRDIPSLYQSIWSASFQYYFTDKDLKAYLEDASLYADDLPVEIKCRYYLNNWSETRFFREDKKIVWDTNRGWPYLGTIYPKRIRLKHYQYRSPQQIQSRTVLRLKAHQKNPQSFLHEAQKALDKSTHSLPNEPNKGGVSDSGNELWKTRIVQASELNYDYLINSYQTREDIMPPLPQARIPMLANRFRYLRKYSESKYMSLFFTRKRVNKSK